MDEFGRDFNSKVLTAVKVESDHLQKVHCPDPDPGSADLVQQPQSSTSNSNVAMVPADNGRKLVFDNFDFKQHVHDMSEKHQNIDIHWVTHLAVENRVPGNHLQSTIPSDGLSRMDNGVCLPSRHEHFIQRANYITIVERVIVANISCLSFLKPVAVNHIPHKYTKETSEPTNTVCIIISCFIIQMQVV